jgi:quercetin dioxygenase-like cupin family protein
MEPIILDPGAGDGDDELRIKLSTDDVGVVEFDVDKDSVEDHAHDREEIFYVLEGRMTFRADGRTQELEAGGFVYIPAGTRHGFEHDAPARYLVTSVPGGLENYFAETAQAEESGADKGELEQIAERYGTRFLG